MNEPGGATIRLSKLQAGILTTALTAAVLAVAANLWQLNLGVRDLQNWKANLDAANSILNNTVPRSEAELREKLIFVEIEQLRVRLGTIELRERNGGER